MDNRPIGLFDSGIGGTSIWAAIHKLMPGENTIYLADSKYAPYGSRSKADILKLCIKNTELLLKFDSKIIVVACNTATTNAIKELRSTFKIPFIGIEPALKPAAIHSKTQSIGILATKGTLSSELFNKAVEIYQDISIVEQIGHGLVELIEAGKIDSAEMDALLNMYLQPMIEANVDYLVLGCSHYPYLIPKIREVLPIHITIIDSGEAVARQTENILRDNVGFADAEKGDCVFYSNGQIAVLSEVLGTGHQVSYLDF